ncbi:MAG: heavy metal translocating P-type ATPase metal-binding domain-containing protein [Flavobacteriaceae bacterium]|nr:heavy metal translocating P-type ATPase metal-binding domain-containing protein [Flavobacteriaceae bacterium]
MPKEICYHCGLDCPDKQYQIGDKCFCCNGCKTVYEILNQNELGCYYDFEQNPGTIPTKIKGKYNYLDNKKIAEKLLEFNDDKISVVSFYTPNIHCNSCIWVLENLSKLHNGIVTSSVNFPEKKIRITFKNYKISLKQVVELITSIGYEPYISLEDAESGKYKSNKTLIYQIAIAGFAFGNVMLLSFPEYFQDDGFWLDKYKHLFRSLMFVFSVPVVFYSAKDFFISAYKGLKHKILNIDVPIVLGISVLFIRSTIEIVFDLGQGFFDSLTGLVFFLLLGRIFQQRTYNYLSFERDYKSYFPIAVTKIGNEGKEESVEVFKIKEGDRLLIRNEELIPVDGILISSNTNIDYSFVTGESVPVSKKSGDKLFAGGKQLSGAIEMDVLQSVQQSYLTQLWSSDAFKKDSNFGIKNLVDALSKYFTYIILAIAFLAGIYWFLTDKSLVFHVVSSVLIIACPCALALSSPFALGNILRIFGRRKFYLKNAEGIEQAARIDTIIFDKTGTITTNKDTNIVFEGDDLSKKEQQNIRSLIRSSNHPLNRMLYEFLPNSKETTIINFKEILGKGIQGKIHGKSYTLGSANFVNTTSSAKNETTIYVSIDGQIKGRYIFKNSYRKGLDLVFEELSKIYKLIILSGDNEGEKEYLQKILPKETKFYFNQKPEDKLEFIKQRQTEGKQVLMIGDGLNDAGALAQSNFGIAISENTNVFSPACDAILDATQFKELPQFLKLTKQTITVIKASFVLSFMYNIIGMYFAITGQLSPIIAAILMPLSSITIVIFVTILTNLVSNPTTNQH